MTESEEALNYQLYRMTHFVNSQPLPRAIFVTVQWPMNKGVMVAEMGVMRRLDIVNCHLLKLTCPHLLLTTLSVNRDQLQTSEMTPFSPCPTSDLVVGWLQRIPFSTGITLCPNWSRYLFRLCICLSCMYCFCQNHDT